MTEDAGARRVSNAEREDVLKQLGHALSSGAIDTGEFEQRADRASAAQVRADLTPLVADLPPVAREAAGHDDVIELRGTFGSVKRKGRWTVPRTLRLHRRMGSVELDFTEAEFTSDTVDIELDTIGGSVELRVPESSIVDMDRIAVTLGSTEDHRKGPATPAPPHFTISGNVRWGSLEVRGPRRKLFGR